MKSCGTFDGKLTWQKVPLCWVSTSGCPIKCVAQKKMINKKTKNLLRKKIFIQFSAPG